jgi:RNA polymerase sigma factor (sigma-70 family)
MPGRQHSPESGAKMRDVTEIGGWLEHQLPDWPRIWRACQRRTRSWPVPPRWTPQDWREELDSEGYVAACTAIQKFDPTRGPTLGSYVYHHILTGALGRYRQEWRYALHYRSGLDIEAGHSPSGQESVEADDDHVWLRTRMGRLMEDDRRLIQHLYWDNWTESRVAGSMGISQQAVNKRKQKILHELRCSSHAHE